MQLGLIYVAARTGRSIIPTGFGFHRPWRLRSWDRFALPRPWSNSVCVTAAPICVPANAGREELEEYRQRVEEALNHVNALAERLANREPQPTRKKSQLRRAWNHIECMLMHGLRAEQLIPVPAGVIPT